MSNISTHPSDQPTIQDVLTAINDFAGYVETTMATKADLASLQARMATKDDIAAIDNRLRSVESTMVTKDYLDDKLADLRGDLIGSVRKEDNKTTALTKILHTKKVLNKAEIKAILQLGPFVK